MILIRKIQKPRPDAPLKTDYICREALMDIASIILGLVYNQHRGSPVACMAAGIVLVPLRLIFPLLTEKVKADRCRDIACVDRSQTPSCTVQRAF